MRQKLEDLKTRSTNIISSAKAHPKTDEIITPRVKPEITAAPQLRGMSKISGTPRAIKLKAWTEKKLSSLKTSWNGLEISNTFKSAQAQAAPLGTKMGDVMKDKLGLNASINSNALATLIMASLAFLFLLLGLSKPSRKL